MNIQLTPTQLIKKAILQSVPLYYSEFKCPNDLLTAEDIEAAWDYADENDYLDDATSEFREGDFETPEIEAGFSRYCELKGVGAKIDDFFIGWIYEYGGGRHFEESGEWLYDAYFLDRKEEVVTITQRTFTKK